MARRKSGSGMRWPRGAVPGDVAAMEDLLRRHALIIAATEAEMARWSFTIVESRPLLGDVVWRTFDDEQEAQLTLDGLRDLYQVTDRVFYLRAVRREG